MDFGGWVKLAVGDFFIYINNNLGATTNYVPVGTAKLMQVSIGSASDTTSYISDGATTSTTSFFTASTGQAGSMTYHAENSKIIIDNTNYGRYYSTQQLNACFIQVA